MYSRFRLGGPETTLDAPPERSSGRTNPQRSAPCNTEQEVKGHLTTIALEICQAANGSDFTAIASKYYAPNCAGFHDMDTELWELGAGDGVVAQIEKFLESEPGFYNVVEDVSVDVGKKLDRAVVWIVRTDSGLSDGLRRESVLRLTFTWGEAAGWVITNSSGIRHFPFFTADETLSGGGMGMWSSLVDECGEGAGLRGHLTHSG